MRRAALQGARLRATVLLGLALSGCADGSLRYVDRRPDAPPPASPPLADYVGNAGYGVNPAASRAKAARYRARAPRRDYGGPLAPAWASGPPGPLDASLDPQVDRAAARFGIPAQWIREVMRRESGGRLRGADGALLTSWAGAMGPMQVMPLTYDILRRRYGLGDDPYDPDDNIAAGAAYIREMYDRFGAPGFLAAYNAGPQRVDAYLAGAALPDETVRYVAAVAPLLGDGVAMSGPLSGFAGSYAREPYEGGGATVLAAAMRRAAAEVYASHGQPVGGAASPDPTPDRGPPVGRLPHVAMAPGYAGPAAPDVVPRLQTGQWGAEIGAFDSAAAAAAALSRARAAMDPRFAEADDTILTYREDGRLRYRVMLTGLTGPDVAQACDALVRRRVPCLAVAPGG